MRTTTFYRAPATGTYEVTLAARGDSFLDATGRPLLRIAGLQDRTTVSTTLVLRARSRTRFILRWFQQPGVRAPEVTITDVSLAIAKAAVLARGVDVPIVFAGDPESEGSDRQTLSLPGDENALISAVAAANPRTVVVLNTGGAVTTPWLHQVAAVIEAWYPGEEDGNALAAVLLGSVDPSGRLPLTFPAGAGHNPVDSPAQWPGVDGVASFAGGLDIGYRGYLAKHLPMRFPFGYGLSYTSFRLSALRVHRRPGRDVAQVAVTNSGSRSGTAVVEAYLSFPRGNGEPPIELAGLATVSLAAGSTKTVSIRLPQSVFLTAFGGSFHVADGSYVLSVGQSAGRRPLRARLVPPSSGG